MATESKTLLTPLVARLRDALPPGWKVELRDGPEYFAGTLLLRVPGTQPGIIQVDIPSATTPGALEARLPRSRRLLLPPPATLLVAARYLSPEARRVLTAAEVSYFDLTGNLRVATSQPPIFVQDRGADRNPERSRSAARSLRGDKSLAIVRALCDYIPPISPGVLARIARATPGNVSKLLAKLQHEGLVERLRRGAVTRTAWRSIIEARAAEVDLLQSGVWSTYVPMTGGPQLMAAIAAKANAGVQVAVTGGYAVEDVAQVGGSRLFCYTSDAELLARDLPLRREQGMGHVVLLEPSSAAVFDRMRIAHVLTPGVPCVALSQAAIDCLSGPDRMPEAGLAVLDWMERHEADWRQPLPSER